jgi:hypothetical protein
MSTLATNAITDASGGNTATINSYTPTVSNMAGRNRIINGDMRIDQRNAGAAVTINSSAYTYPVDRFAGFGESTDGVFTLQQSSTAPTGFTNSLLATVTTADASIGASQRYFVRQGIEGYNIADLGYGTAAAATVTLSFYVRSSLTGTFGGSFMNDAFNRAYPFTYTISTANTWEQKSVTIAGDTSGTWLTTNGGGIYVIFSIGAGSSRVGTAGAWQTPASPLFGATGQTNIIATNGATWAITGVQLEAGSVATPFEHRQYGQELALCQRYLPVFSALASSRFNAGYFYTSTVFYSNFVFQVPTRVTPTGIATTGSFNATYLTAQQATTPSWFGEASTTQAGVYGVVSGGVSAGIGMALAATSGGGVTIQFTGCEL